MSDLAALLPPCAIRLSLGIPCPGCGLTRGLLLCAQGDWQIASHLHPAAPIIFVQMIVLPTALAILPRGASTKIQVAKMMARKAAWVNCAALIVIWIYRLSAGSIP